MSIRRGLADGYIGERLSNDLAFEREVDLDAEFRMPDGSSRTFRFVRLVVPVQRPDGTTEDVVLRFVTNLSAEQFSVEELATLYRFRWQIERLFMVLKTVGRLDHLQTGKPHIIEAFLYAALLGVVLAMHVCGWMRQTRPEREPSLHRVTALVIGYLPKLAMAMATHQYDRAFREFRAALWREGTNPNPGRPYTGELYEFDLAWQAIVRRVVTT